MKYFFIHLHDILGLHKRHFQIKLSEFRLTIPTLVLIAKTTSHLKILVHARHHKQLFELLGRLRKHKKFSRAQKRGHNVLTTAFGRTLDKDGRFHFHKTALVKQISSALDELMASHQVILHTIAT